MLTIYIARNGQNKDNADGILNGHRDLPLTDVGRRQGRELAEGIKSAGLTFDVVYTSKLSRQYDTAETITEELGLPKPQIMPSLIERNFGVMTGKRIADIKALCSPQIIETKTITYFLCPEGAETFPQLFARGVKILAEVRERHPEGSVLLVTSGDIGKMVYAAYYNLPWEQVLTDFHFGNSELLILSESSSAKESHVIHIEQYNH